MKCANTVALFGTLLETSHAGNIHSQILKMLLHFVGIAASCRISLEKNKQICLVYVAVCHWKSIVLRRGQTLIVDNIACVPVYLLAEDFKPGFCRVIIPVASPIRR